MSISKITLLLLILSDFEQQFETQTVYILLDSEQPQTYLQRLKIPRNAVTGLKTNWFTSKSCKFLSEA